MCSKRVQYFFSLRDTCSYVWLSAHFLIGHGNKLLDEVQQIQHIVMSVVGVFGVIQPGSLVSTTV